MELRDTLMEEDTQHGRFLTFALGSEVFGLEIRHVTQIVGVLPITPIPETPEFVKGVINLRGKILPVIDMRLKFKKTPIAYDDRTCIIIVDIKDVSVGLIVDNVAEVLTIADEDIAPPPQYSSGSQNRYIKGVGKVGSDVKLLLDCERLFNEGEFAVVEGIG